MPVIRIHLYRADRQDEHKLDDIIAGWTKLLNKDTPPYSHAEIQFPDGQCFSSTIRDGKSGTRFKHVTELLKNKHRWDTYYKKVAEWELKVYRSRAESINNRPYYISGLFLDFCLPFGWLSSAVGGALNRWYCSQAVWYVLTGVRRRVSPRRLCFWITKEWGFKKNRRK
jgi:hypothetical protein